MHQSLIIQHLFQVNSLEDVSRERLETFVEEHPSFGIGHYLLSRKLQKEGGGSFTEKTQLTCLYFSNPFWLQWLLENTDVGGQMAAPVAPADIHQEMPVVETAAHRHDEAAAVHKETAAVAQEQSAAVAHEDTAALRHDEAAVVHEETAAVAQDECATVVHKETAAVVHEEPAAIGHEELPAGVTNHAEKPAAEPATEEIPPVENVVTMAEEAFPDGSAATTAVAVGEEAPSAAEQLLRSIEEARELRESFQKINSNFGDEPTANGEAPPPVAAVRPTEAATEPLAATEPTAAATEPTAAETEPLAAVEPTANASESLAAAAQPLAEPPAPMIEPPVVDSPVQEQTPIRDEEVPFVLDETEETRSAAAPETGSQPLAPAQEPAEPGPQPLAPAQEPAEPGPQPAAPAHQSAEPGPQPAAPAHQSAEPAHKPIAIAASPINEATDPTTVAEPAAAASEPIGATEPVVSHREPIAAPDILFEPLHTIDYFASQGIKFNLDENPADALGKQLKSFTDWLKTMRRLPQKNKEVIPDRLAEQAIQDFAAHSIEGKEVLTEAMAEVLAKQGMKQRARAVYEKLSLLSPEKSAYFTAKIEQLNIL